MRPTARDFMRQGIEPEAARWMERVHGAWFSSLILWGSQANRHRGLRRRLHLAALYAGGASMRVHRCLWLLRGR